MISNQKNKYNYNISYNYITKESLPLSLIAGILLSIILIFVDAYTLKLSKLREFASLVVSPIPLVVNYPERIKVWFGTIFKAKQNLDDENQRLRKQILLLQIQLQRWHALQRENNQLRASLASAAAQKNRLIAADVLDVDIGRARQLIILNKGSHDGVTVGQPVLDAQGVMGQVIDVGFLTSTVLLITDTKCAVPVQNARTGERAIVVGTNHSSELTLLHLPKTSTIQPGDLLLTSGLGRLYPAGYPVGKVAEVLTPQGEAFIRVKVRPIAGLNTAQFVLLLGEPQQEKDILAEIKQRYLMVDKLS